MKKTRNWLFVKILSLVIIFITFFAINSFADDSKVIDAKSKRDTYSYAFIGESRVYQRILKLYEVKNANSQSLIYCARGGLGFGGNDTLHQLTYNKIGDLKENKETVVKKYSDFIGTNLDRNEDFTISYSFTQAKFNETTNNEKERFDNLTSFLKNNTDKVSYTTSNSDKLEFKDSTTPLTITVTYKNVNIYNAILGLVDNMYSASKSAERASWIKSAGLLETDLTDEEIDVAQQMALWFFTNKDGNNDFKLSENINMVYTGIDLLSKTGLVASDFSGSVPESVKTIYKHLLSKAVQNSYNYKMSDDGKYITSEAQIEFTANKPKVEITTTATGTYYMVGPFEIVNNGGNNYTNFTCKIMATDSKGAEKELTIDNSEQKVIVTDAKGIKNYQSIESRIGQGEFYIKVLKNIPVLKNVNVYDIANLKLNMSYDYYVSQASLWTTEDKEDQPVVIVDPEKKSNTDEISTVEVKQFDLALRKFISKINDTECNRAPVVDTTSLIKGTANYTEKDCSYSATYTHSKEPITVKNGDTVIYTIRVYNEGEIDGYASKIEDYLPAELEFVKDSELNKKNGWTVSADGRTVTTTALANELIAKFDSGKTLAYKDVQIECKVKDTASAGKILTNIAQIAEYKNNENVKDRDSDGSNVTKPTDDNLPDYKKWQEDEDDFDKVIVETKTFDLALRKFISKVNSTEYDRAPVVDTTSLIKGTANYTEKDCRYSATYTHSKTPITVKKGDTVTYTIRVYNEGEIDGYASKVEDYLPAELEFVKDSELNKKNGWTVSEDGRTVTTTALANELIAKFDGGKTLAYKDVQIECKVKDTTSTGKILTNIAQIVEYKNSENVKDIDSDGSNVTKPSDTDLPDYKKWQEDEDDFEKVIIETKPFDMALRKYITKLERDEKVVTIENSRDLNNIDTSTIATKGTATYKHRKDPVEVQTNDIVTYTFRVYNESETTGYVTSIIDYIPEGLELCTEGLTLDKEKSTDTKLVYSQVNYNVKSNVEGGLFPVVNYTVDTLNNTLEITYDVVPTSNNKMFKLEPFDATHKDEENKGIVTNTGWVNGLNYGEISVKFEVTEKSQSSDKVLTNFATMKYYSEGNIADSDSKPAGENGDTSKVPTNLIDNPGYTGGDTNYKLEELENKDKYYNGYEDDDDFEKIIIKGVEFDLSLRKFITKINDKDVEESREPKVNLDTLNNGTKNESGKTEYTATYNHTKEPLTVQQGDIVKYTIRIYNEGNVDGYATKVSDYLPAGLGLLINYNDNLDNNWVLTSADNIIPLVGENGLYQSESEVSNLNLKDFTNMAAIDNDTSVKSFKQVNIATGKTEIYSTLLNTEKISAYDAEGKKLDYKDIEVTCIVLAENTYKGALINIAEISEAKAVDSKGKELVIDDRDSKPKNVDLDNYTIKDENSTYQQDDDDYEPLTLELFDLALRKFITKVNGEEPEVSREPIVDTTQLINGTATTATYTHTKEPLAVANGDEVEYTIRVYNEGTRAGIASEICDDIPEGLVFDPENETNIEYGWKMYKEVESDAKKFDFTYNNKKYVETGDSSEATMIRTRNLDMFEIMPLDFSTGKIDYGDVKVVFTVDEKFADVTRTIKNEAQITEDNGDDRDSEPNKWQGEDDEDIENIYIKIFDLSLLKWVTQSIVTVDGVTTTNDTGFMPNTGLTETTEIRDNSEAEPIAKVEVNKKKLSSTEVKFVYKIRVTNEGELAGYATELTDYIPEGLEFVEADNTAFGWQKTSDGKIITRALETVLLEPGDSTEVEVVFKWINDSGNLGLKTNIAEISEDYSINNDKSEDIDSTPNNKIDDYEKEQEDDDDFALVILSIKTGGTLVQTYIGVITAFVAVVAVGIILIKKYVIK